VGIQDNSMRDIADLAMPYDVGPIGNLRQVNQVGSPARSNSSWIGATFVATIAGPTAAGTGLIVCVPIQVNDLIEKVRLCLGATSGAEIESMYVALYKGTGAKPAAITKAGSTAALQSAAIEPTSENGEGKADTKGAPLKEHRLTFTLEEQVQITEEMAPKGFVYLLINIAKAGASKVIPTLTGVTASTGAHKALAEFTSGSPLALAAESQGSLTTGTAPTSLSTVTAVAGIPLVALF
jgi:hypothetical protein